MVTNSGLFKAIQLQCTCVQWYAVCNFRAVVHTTRYTAQTLSDLILSFYTNLHCGNTSVDSLSLSTLVFTMHASEAHFGPSLSPSSVPFAVTRRNLSPFAVALLALRPEMHCFLRSQ